MGVKLSTPGDIIHVRRRDLGITKAQAARMAGLSDSEWRDIERGGKRPSDEALAAIARVLRLDAAKLKLRYP